MALVSGSIGTFFYRCAVDSLHGSVQGPADARAEPNVRFLSALRDFQAADPDVAFVDVTRREGDQVRNAPRLRRSRPS